MSDERNPVICQNADCLPGHGRDYCLRCTISVKKRMFSNLSSRDIAAHLDKISRQRSLSEVESVVLEYALQCIDASERSCSRMATARTKPSFHGRDNPKVIQSAAAIGSRELLEGYARYWRKYGVAA